MIQIGAVENFGVTLILMTGEMGGGKVTRSQNEVSLVCLFFVFLIAAPLQVLTHEPEVSWR